MTSVEIIGIVQEVVLGLWFLILMIGMCNGMK